MYNKLIIYQLHILRIHVFKICLHQLQHVYTQLAQTINDGYSDGVPTN